MKSQNSLPKVTPIIAIVFWLILILGLLFSKDYISKKLFSSPPKSPTIVKVGEKIKIKYPQDYTLVLVGDSMTELLGNSDELKAYLKKYYPQKSFEVLNYGFGSTNILSLQKRLEEKTFYGREFRPITEIDFDLILIESFGHNPLSEYSLEEGLKKQEEALEQVTQTIKLQNPKAKIVFVATIAPSKRHYARGKVELSDEQRKVWAEEREVYIKNHVQFANDNNIPIINIFEKSLNKEGEVNLDYINQADYIHPSPNGIIFISQQMADFIYQNKILE